MSIKWVPKLQIFVNFNKWAHFFIVKDQAERHFFMYFITRDEISLQPDAIKIQRRSICVLTKPYSSRVAGVILRFVFPSLRKKSLFHVRKCLLNFMDRFEDRQTGSSIYRTTKSPFIHKELKKNSEQNLFPTILLKPTEACEQMKIIFMFLTSSTNWNYLSKLYLCNIKKWENFTKKNLFCF